MKQIAFGFFILFVASSAPQLHANDPPRVHMPDGQLMSKPVKVYVSDTNLSLAQNPRLRLVGAHLFTKPNADQLKDWPASLVASGQSWSENVAGQGVSRVGTLLLFNLSSNQVPWYKATIRFEPWLSWDAVPQGGESKLATLVGNQVYLGRLWVAVLWTGVVVVAVVLVIWRWSVRPEKSAVWLVCGEEGYLSLWRVQLAAWTLAVGSLVFCFGLLRLEVPKIPETLVALMGMSVATGGFSSAAKRTPPAINPNPPRMSDLISSFSLTSKDGELSIPKAQMVFWTVIILVMFIAKSLLIGELWAVPWEMVALTGVSQVGYVTDKAAKNKEPLKPAAPKGKVPATP